MISDIVNPTIAVYAGSFDPVTKGHLWVIQEAIKLFDELHIAIGINPSKKNTFSVETRTEMILASLEEIGFDLRMHGVAYGSRINVGSFENEFLINYARKIGASYLVRGIRTESDFEYEREMMHINLSIDPNIQTIFLMPPKEVGNVSSSMVKGFVGPQGWEDIASKFVTQNVLNELKKIKG